jgi:hypothetical protein
MVVQFDVEAALRRQLVRQLMDKLPSNSTFLTQPQCPSIIVKKGFARRLKCHFTSTSVRNVDSAPRRSRSFLILH